MKTNAPVSWLPSPSGLIVWVPMSSPNVAPAISGAGRASRGTAGWFRKMRYAPATVTRSSSPSEVGQSFPLGSPWTHQLSRGVWSTPWALARTS